MPPSCDLPENIRLAPLPYWVHTYRGLDGPCIWISSEFKQLAMESFEQWLLPKLRLKSGLETLDSFSVESSLWDNEDAALNAFMSNMRSGGLFTNKIKSKFSGVSDQCKLCGQQDGMKHRIYNCPHSVHARGQVDWDLLSELPSHSMLWRLFGKPWTRCARQQFRFCDANRKDTIFSRTAHALLLRNLASLKDGQHGRSMWQCLEQRLPNALLLAFCRGENRRLTVQKFTLLSMP